MDMDKIKEFIKLAKDSGLSELSYEAKDEKIRVKLPYGSDMPMLQALPAMTGAAPQAQSTAAPVEKRSDLLEVVSPFVGTFYRTPSPDSDPYVKVGDHISSGQVLCIVEAMKIMNEIESDVQGEIVEICVENETYVEYGQVLFRVKK